MGLDFTGKRVVITGGSRGIGRAIALAFAKAGADLSICARGAATLAATHAELAATGRNIHSAICDLANAAAIAAYVAEAGATLGGIDVLVSNASGIDNSADAWADCFNVDVMAAVRTAEAVEPFLAKANSGSIINISSISGMMPSAESPAYAAAKAALINLTASQAVRLAPQRIRVNGIAPGSIDFPGGYWDRCRAETPKVYDDVRASIPFGRYGKPEEIANAALFLASPLASWITGQTLVVDGGQVLRA
jgi:3-oxoacyl-[acyl-carrier protein] reductase